MIQFILRRLLLMVPTTLGIALVVFAIFHAAPGDPATVMMGGGGSGELGQNSDVEGRVDKFRRKHGLDRSLLVQFLDYVGPFNLDRDGHPWFSTPFTERKTEEVELADGRVVREGTPQRIEPLPGTDPARVEELEVARETLLDEAADPAVRSAAAETLVAAGSAGLPPLLTALYELRESVGTRPDTVERTLAAVRAVAGPDAPQVDAARAAELGPLAEMRHWFAWYYANGGYRVANSGERPWGGLLVGDLRREMQSDLPIGVELGKRLKVTVPLALISVLLSYLIALPLGIFSARNHGTLRDGAVTVGLFVLFAVPTFWAGLMLILIFGKTGLDWLPVLGLHDKDAEAMGAGAYAWDLVKHSLLPIVTLTYASLAYLSRQMRAGMMETLRQDYIRTARAKGLSEDKVVYKHALRNSMIPVLTLLASVLPVLIGGSVIVEKVFEIPGMGRYAFEGLLKRDFNIIMATTIFVGIMTQFGILLSDITYSLVDPRIRHD